jgi:hypothetical protein
MNPYARARRELVDPHAHVRSLPPEGELASLEAPRRELVDPHAHVRSLPPEGELASLEAPRRETP